jgi:cell wall assembly regulator SMI1
MMSLSPWQAEHVADAEWAAVLRSADGYRLEEAAQAADIAELESALGVTIPDALRALYLTSDGIFDDPGSGS